MYNIEKICEVMQKHGFTHENDERTCWNLGAGLHIRFDDDMDEPGIVLSHNSTRDYFSRKFTMDEIESILEVITLFNLGTEKVVEIYNSATENNAVVAHLPLSSLDELKDKVVTLTTNLDDLAEDYNELLEERNELHDSYEIAQKNIDQLLDENTELDKSNRSHLIELRRMRDDYQTYRRVLTCIMSQFEGREIDW